MNKRIIIVACTMACGTATADPPAEPAPIIHRNPPPPSRTVVTFTGNTFNMQDAVRYNPQVDGKTVFRTRERTCFVDGEFASDSTPFPGQRPPAVAIDCPREMNDNAYDLCNGGTIYQQAEACGCFVMGNPPPPAREMSRCPAHPRAEQGD